jgi:hypothetical protein
MRRWSDATKTLYLDDTAAMISPDGVFMEGTGYDNAATESWNHRLKVEAIHGERFATRDAAKAQVFD